MRLAGQRLLNCVTFCNHIENRRTAQTTAHGWLRSGDLHTQETWSLVSLVIGQVPDPGCLERGCVPNDRVLLLREVDVANAIGAVKLRDLGHRGRSNVELKR
jgi:hypothetical protein